jgi:hypothetical protein
MSDGSYQAPRVQGAPARRPWSVAADLVAWAEWEDHVAAGRIGEGPAPAPAGEHRLGTLAALLGRG